MHCLGEMTTIANKWIRAGSKITLSHSTVASSKQLIVSSWDAKSEHYQAYVPPVCEVVCFRHQDLRALYKVVLKSGSRVV